jgi:hypothetical protein
MLKSTVSIPLDGVGGPPLSSLLLKYVTEEHVILILSGNILIYIQRKSYATFSDFR